MAASATTDQSKASSLAEKIASEIRKTALSVCWEQWRSLGAFAGAASSRHAQAIVDPESLVLLSLLLREEEHRLDDFLGWWAGAGSELLSVQRMHNLAGRFPANARPLVRSFARLATNAGDKRWRRYAAAEEEEPHLIPRQGKGAEQPVLDAPPALLLRLRAAFGVGAKADLFAFLLGMEGAYVTTSEAAAATAYSDVAVRTAAQEMVLARFAREDADNRPTRFAVDPEPWAPLLRLPANSRGKGDTDAWPVWRYWAEVFAFFAEVLQWARRGETEQWSTYVWSSRARDLAEKHARLRKLKVAERPGMNERPGLVYLEAFSDWAHSISAWACEKV